MLLNCDMGESFGNYTIGSDKDVMPYIDMANIACGMHASDPDVMDATVALASQHDVMVGAHPGYPDMQGFGRRDMHLSPVEIKNLVLYQVGALAGFCEKYTAKLEYIKPHGALYHAMMKRNDIMEALLEVAQVFRLKLMILATSGWQDYKKLAEGYGINLLLEAFVDRGYEDDGSLLHRSEAHALLSEEEMEARVRALCLKKPILSVNNKELNFPIDTLCIHGDGKGTQLVRSLRAIIDARST